MFQAPTRAVPNFFNLPYFSERNNSVEVIEELRNKANMVYPQKEFSSTIIPFPTMEEDFPSKPMKKICSGIHLSKQLSKDIVSDKSLSCNLTSGVNSITSDETVTSIDGVYSKMADQGLFPGKLGVEDYFNNNVVDPFCAFEAEALHELGLGANDDMVVEHIIANIWSRLCIKFPENFETSWKERIEELKPLVDLIQKLRHKKDISPIDMKSYLEDPLIVYIIDVNQDVIAALSLVGIRNDTFKINGFTDETLDKHEDGYKRNDEEDNIEKSSGKNRINGTKRGDARRLDHPLSSSEELAISAAAAKRRLRVVPRKEYDRVDPQLWKSIENRLTAEELQVFDDIIQRVYRRRKVTPEETTLISNQIKNMISWNDCYEVETVILTSVHQLLEQYKEFVQYPVDDIHNLLVFCNAMKLCNRLVPGRFNKGLLMRICAEVEGLGRQYITGSGQSTETYVRVKVYEQECGVQVVPRPPRKRGHRDLDTLKERKGINTKVDELSDNTDEDDTFVHNISIGATSGDSNMDIDMKTTTSSNTAMDIGLYAQTRKDICDAQQKRAHALAFLATRSVSSYGNDDPIAKKAR